MISIKGLHKFFYKGKQNEIHVINDISLELPEKGMVAIFGKSGCGKTTLLNVIGGLDGFAEGSLTIENNDIGKNTDAIRNKYIGYIFQNYNLHKEETCYENVASALRLCGMTDEKEIDRRVDAALTNVGMDKYKRRTPDTLSGGQQQRIAIARTIVKNPRIILADEPTGNLDEANTLMIMDLLKAISREHLVLLVTHEANLVDYYCDKVIELSDGQVVSVKENSSANGYATRDKNHIYLGELPCHQIADENAVVEYYGEKPKEPIKLKIVNNGGKLYVQLGTEKVQIIDSFSEVRLKDGVYEEKPNSNALSSDIDMSKLPPVQGTKFGKLFSFKSSLKSGYNSNFKSTKKGNKALRACMCLFSAVVVFMTAVFGSAFGEIIEAKKAYNHNVFYVYTEDGRTSELINEAVGKSDTGVDFIRLTGSYPTGDSNISFRTGSFETFNAMDYSTSFETNAVYLAQTLAKDLSLVEGKKNIENDELLITTKVADALLEKSSLGYIKERKDLIGLIANGFSIEGKSPRIAGIVESKESAVYLTELAMAKYVRQSITSSFTALASSFGMNVNKSEAILAIKNPRTDVKMPAVGETIKIQGLEFKIVEIRQACYDYNQWVIDKGLDKYSDYAFFESLVQREQPTLEVNTQEYYSEVDKAMGNRYFEYYDYYYSDIKDFCRDLLLFEPMYQELWLYVSKGVEVAKYAFMPEEYYKATEYKKLYGSYPTPLQLENHYYELPELMEEIESYRMAYEDEYYTISSDDSFYYNTYLVSEADYVALSKQVGETHPSATETGEYSYKDVEVQELSAYVSNDIVYFGNMCYTVIHSENPEVTEEWLIETFPELLEGEDEFFIKLYTPSEIFDSIVASNMEAIITSIITMTVILILMCICMYFIMRSSLMNRIKEVGIYRAIGVTKKNLIFKFFIETLVLTTLTVLIGYLLTSAFMFACLGISSLVSQIFYYPVWLALIVIAVLYVISLFFGTLPILSLLRKTPSEILAKYDI